MTLGPHFASDDELDRAGEAIQILSPEPPDALLVALLSAGLQHMGRSYPSSRDMAVHGRHASDLSPDLMDIAGLNANGFVRFLKILAHFQSIAIDYRPETRLDGSIKADTAALKQGDLFTVIEAACRMLHDQLHVSAAGVASAMTLNALEFAKEHGVSHDQLLRIQIEALSKTLDEMPIGPKGHAVSYLPSFEREFMTGRSAESRAARRPRKPGRRSRSKRSAT